MGSLPQLERDLGEVEQQLQQARRRLGDYRAGDESALAAHTRQVVAGLAATRQALLAQVRQVQARLQNKAAQ